MTQGVVMSTEQSVERWETMMASRREFLANGFGTALLAAVTPPSRAHEPRSAHGQSRDEGSVYQTVSFFVRV